MSVFKRPDNAIVRRLRWIMLGVMLVSMIATLTGQPAGFWHNPERATRFDGLSIYDHTNRKFEFFLGHGWAPYVTACTVYFVSAFAIVSLVPPRLAQIAIFAFIFGHFYGGSNWFAVRWQMGVRGPMVYAWTLAALLSLTILPVLKNAEFTAKRLRWIATGALLLDFMNTLIGQPHTYWRNPATVHEGNALSRFFLLHGWVAFALYDVAYCVCILLLPVLLPRAAAMICMFALLLGGYGGACNWFFYEWRMGIVVPILYGFLLAALIVVITFPRIARPSVLSSSDMSP